MDASEALDASIHGAASYQTLEALAHAVLDGASAPGANVAKEVVASLDWLLLSQIETIDWSNPDEAAAADQAIKTLRELAASAPQRVCVTTFTQGDVIWKCRTCQVGDETCVICQSCFQGGDHEGHEVSFYISRQPDGGCCDCGDESAWARSGFCSRHGCLSTTAELVASMPPPLLAAAESIFASLFALLGREALAAEAVEQHAAATTESERASLRQRLHRLALAVEWLTATCSDFDGLCCVATAALCSPAAEVTDLAAVIASDGALPPTMPPTTAAADGALVGDGGDGDEPMAEEAAGDAAAEGRGARRLNPRRLAPPPIRVRALLAAGVAPAKPPTEATDAEAVAERSASRAAVLSASRAAAVPRSSGSPGAAYEVCPPCPVAPEEPSAGRFSLAAFVGGGAAAAGQEGAGQGAAWASTSGGGGGGGGATVPIVTLLDRLLLCDVHLRAHSDTLPHALHALYLRLLTNLEFKHAFAAAYAANYLDLARSYMDTHLDDGLLFASQISVWDTSSVDPTELHRRSLLATAHHRNAAALHRRSNSSTGPRLWSRSCTAAFSAACSSCCASCSSHCRSLVDRPRARTCSCVGATSRSSPTCDS